MIMMAFLSAMLFTANTTAQPSQFIETFRRECKDAGIVGASFVLMKDGKMIAGDHYGFANLEKNQPVNENTIYHWASNTKPFTGIAIMQLRDRGLLKLDDPVTKYLPELRDVHNGFGSMDTIWMGSDFDGAFAEFETVPAAEVFPLDCGWSDAELATIPCAYGTA
jgi:CubicO group peptidase (beta-lactamase class C family)